MVKTLVVCSLGTVQGHADTLVWIAVWYSPAENVANWHRSRTTIIQLYFLHFWVSSDISEQHWCESLKTDLRRFKLKFVQYCEILGKLLPFISLSFPFKRWKWHFISSHPSTIYLFGRPPTIPDNGLHCVSASAVETNWSLHILNAENTFTMTVFKLTRLSLQNKKGSVIL